jgi:quinol monooxygenase YgiN
LSSSKWESLDHLGAQAHLPHMAAYAAKTRDLLANREIHVCARGVAIHDEAMR